MKAYLEASRRGVLRCYHNLYGVSLVCFFDKVNSAFDYLEDADLLADRIKGMLDSGRVSMDRVRELNNGMNEHFETARRHVKEFGISIEHIPKYINESIATHRLC